MTDPKNPEAMNEELNLEQLEDAAGGIGATCTPVCVLGFKKNLKENVGTTAGPGGTTFPKTNIGGSADPGGDDV